MTFGWSADFVLLIGEEQAAAQIAIAHASTAMWILIHRYAGTWRYVFSREEFEQRLHEHQAGQPAERLHQIDLRDALGLHEGEGSTQETSEASADADYAARLARLSQTPAVLGDTRTTAGQVAPIDSTQRSVIVDATGKSIRVGGPDVSRNRTTRGVQKMINRLRPPLSARDIDDDDMETASGAAELAGEATTATRRTVDADEGTTPIRYPSIEPLDSVCAGMPVTLEIDLLQQRTVHTIGEALTLGALAPTWTTLDVAVTLVSAAIDFGDDAHGSVTVRRNDHSLAARITGRVHDGVAIGSSIDVTAQFWYGTRFSGMAMRSLLVSASTDEHSSTIMVPTALDAPNTTRGSVQVDTAAVMPDVTIYIALFDPTSPGRMHWRMVVTPPFATLPPKLDGLIDLGSDPRAEAAAMFKQFANLERGKHERTFLGFGENLWDRAPVEFRNVYWALHDHFHRELTLQFVSDDPHLPWELMAPYRSNAGVVERHGPLALRHAVARWIGQYAGLMRNTLPAGRMVTIAPRYRRANLMLSKAEATANALQAAFHAESVDGTCTAMLQLLEDPPAAAVGLLYFTGHGAVSADSAAASLIKLEDGTLSVNDVAQQGVQLGRRDGTLVFFNACEVGATAELLGTVGGWASAFLSREFRAFVAPLWAIDEEDAVTVTSELLANVYGTGKPVGAALRDVRKTFGAISPTFYSYLLFGDVTAHFPGLPRQSLPPILE